MSDNAPILIVPIERVTPHGDILPSYSLRKMQSVLIKQGQIEPLQVKIAGDGYVTFPQDVHGDYILCSARALGWDTILIAVVNRYEF